ncbi:Tyrosine protein phosphatase non receptor type [Fasciola gigantica]|uniref:protein-tyrosine-phosphatase n=1 Tax=Fasciola gigantica TaxID=46835 RepID=A0A504X5P6_FASGI|nr:Tyrosine protein phosphatase non receptor type [Fasciola gigantica]
MPIKLNFKRTHRYNVSAKDLYVIRIFTLDGTCVEYTVSTTTTGRDALDYVAQRLDIDDTCFFGFKYEDWSGESRWLFLNKSVKKQLDKHARQHALTLTVMLFIDNPQFISDSQLRRFFYLQLRQDVATGLLPVTLKLGIKLSAYSLQADFGDFVDVETTLSNWRERSSLNEASFCGAFDLSTTEYVDDILWGYLHLQGVSQDNAIWYFLDEIRHIPRYGVRTFRGATCRNEPAELGVSRNGINITTLEPQQRTTANLKWEHIKDLTYSRKTFTIQLLKKNKAVHFIFEESENARYLWQFCIQMHSSYIEYWTRVKSAPQQPAIQVSEPPDILRGTELRCLNPGSPMMNEALPDGTSSPLVPQLVKSSQHGAVAARDDELSNEMHSVGAVHGVDFPGQFVPNTEHRTFKIHPNRLGSGSVNGVNTNMAGVQDTDEPFLSSSAPTEPGPLERENLGLLAAMNDAVGCGSGGTGAGDSEAGTLIGQWSLRSAADTLDSQMVNQGCVTCLPGRECLRPAAGWFQPRTGITSQSENWNVTGQRHGNGARKSIKSDPTNREIVPPEVKITRSPVEERHEHHTRHHHHRQHQCGTEIDLSGSNLTRSEQKESQTCQPKRQRHQPSKTISISTSLVQRTGVPMGGVNVIVDGAPSSPSSLASSDTSYGHQMASSRASLSSTSSSCCSTRIKKPSDALCGPISEHGARSGPGVAVDSYSLSSSLTSSVNSAAVEENARDPEQTMHPGAEESGKKTHFGFTAALCSVAHNIAFKQSGKVGPRQSGRVSTTSPTRIGSSTLNTGRKLWHELIQSNHGGLRPLLTGFSQHHYRPQVQLKRQQAAADATVQDQCPSLGTIGSDNAVTVDNDRLSKGRRNSGGAGVFSSGIAINGGNVVSSPLHDFQRWINAAKQRLPAAWTNSVASRGMTLQISAPLPSNAVGVKRPLEGKKADMVISSNLRALRATQYGTPTGSHELPVLETSLPGRLARSSSEACARDLSRMRGLRFTKIPSTQFSAPQQQSPLCADSMERPSLTHSRGAISGDRPGPPTIHLYPPSPTQTSYSHHSTSLESDPLHSKPFLSCGSHSEDSGCPNTQVDSRETDQTCDVYSNCLGPMLADARQQQSNSEQEIGLHHAPVENRTSYDTPSQRNVHMLQRQGAFRAPPQWRLVPRPLNLVDRGLSTTSTVNVTEGTTLSNLLLPSTMNQDAESPKRSQLPLTMLSHQTPETHYNVGQLHTPAGQSEGSRVLCGLDSSANGHFSAPPSTPSGRLHFVWTDLTMDSNPTPVSSDSQVVNTALPTRSTEQSANGMNLSDYLSSGNHMLTKETSGNDTLNKPITCTEPSYAFTEGREQKKGSPEQLKQQQQQQQQQQQHAKDSEKIARGTVGDGDPSCHPVNALLTTSSSSEQSSTQRPQSSGPIHLLTHSDIHQLLSLTNIRETELAHRLLAEYRQALLQQHSLHTNSVSTPNLTASQELQMFSSSTAAEEIEEVEVDPVTSERPKSKRTKHSKSHGQRDQQPGGHPKQAHSRPDFGNQNSSHYPTSFHQETSDFQAPHRRRRRRKDPNSNDSPDYVNAAAFQGERCGAGERPLSLASSTDMESNGTFRVLSSLDTRTSSIACGSFGNLTAAGTSFGSGDGTGFDLIQGLQNATGTFASNVPNSLTATSTILASNSAIPDTSADRSPRHSALDQSSQPDGGTGNDMNNLPDPSGKSNDLFGLNGWNKTAESPPDLCLSSTYPNLREGQRTVRDTGQLMNRQPGTFSDLSPRQGDQSFRRNLVGEYENLESLSNEKLQHLRSARQPTLPTQQSKTQSDAMRMTSDTTLDENQNGSLSTLGYSTNTTIPASPSSESVSSSSSMSSTVYSSSASSATSFSSSDLGCTALISDPIREIEDGGSAQCETTGLSPTPCHSSPHNMDNPDAKLCLPLRQTEQQQQHQRHHHHHHHHHRNCHPAPPTGSPPACSVVTHQQQQQQQPQVGQQHRTKPIANVNLTTLFHRHECLGEKWTSRKVLFVPGTIRSSRRLPYCPCKCHQQPVLTKSNSLRLNSATNKQMTQTVLTKGAEADNTNASREDGGKYAKNMTSNDVNATNVCDRGCCDPEKAYTLNSFAGKSYPLIKPRQPTPVRFRTNQMHLSTSQSSQNCRRPSGHLLKAWRHGTSSPHNKQLKSCLKSLPYSSERSTGTSCLSYSDEDVTEALYYVSDDERHRTDDATSATLSATESPCFSSASSYSFSTSSLDAKTEELCPYYHHWYAPSCTPTPLVFHEPERARRGGSLDPSASVQRLPGWVRQKRTSQPSSHRSSHRKRSLELHSLQSNPPHCPFVQQYPCVCYTSNSHGHIHSVKSLSKVGLHQSLEENRQNRSKRRMKAHQVVSLNSTPPGVPIGIRSHHVHGNENADIEGNKNSTNNIDTQESQIHRAQLLTYSHQRRRQHRHHHHPHHRHHTVVPNEVTGRVHSSTGTKPPVAKRKSNELRELTTSESGTRANENLSRLNSTGTAGSSCTGNSTVVTITNARCGSAAEVSLKLLRPKDLQLNTYLREPVTLRSSPGFGSFTPTKEPRERNSPTGSGENTDRTPTLTGSRIPTAEDKSHTLQIGSCIRRSPRASPEILPRPLMRSPSNESETKNLSSPTGSFLGRYTPSMIPSRARQSEDCGTQSNNSSQLPSPLADHSRSKAHPVTLPSTKGSFFTTGIPDRPKTLQVTPSRVSPSSPSAVICTSSLLVNPLQASLSAVGDIWPSKMSALRQPEISSPSSHGLEQTRTLGSPTTQATNNRSQLFNIRSQLVRSGSLEPTTDLSRRGVTRITRHTTTVASKLTPPPRNATEEARTALRPASGLTGKLTDKQMNPSRFMIDPSSCASKPSVAWSLAEKGNGGISHPLPTSHNASSSLEKRA